jgi:hypothetical protein
VGDCSTPSSSTGKAPSSESRSIHATKRRTIRITAERAASGQKWAARSSVIRLHGD